jgi:succinate dehydrogenase (ubiquinone) membrane anchor subunit
MSLIPLLGIGITFPNPVTNFVMAFAIPIHCHLGVNSILVDYLHKRKFPRIGPIASGLLYASTAISIIALFKFNTNDVGIGEGIQRLWNGKIQENTSTTTAEVSQ